MKAHQLFTASLFWGAAAFISSVFNTGLCAIAATFGAVCLLLALSAWNEKKRFAEMRDELRETVNRNADAWVEGRKL